MIWPYTINSLISLLSTFAAMKAKKHITHAREGVLDFPQSRWMEGSLTLGVGLLQPLEQGNVIG